MNPEEEPEEGFHPNTGEVADVNPVDMPKQKKKMTDKQKEALERGRQKGLELKAKAKELTEKMQIVKKVAKEHAIQEKVSQVEDLSKFVDATVIRKHIETMQEQFDRMTNKFESIDTQFSTYLQERTERKKNKDLSSVETSIKKQLPDALSRVILQDKIEKNMKTNPYMGYI